MEKDNKDTMLITSSSPHVHSGTSVHGIMRDVLIGLVPAAIASIYFFGIKALILIIVCVASCLVFEYISRKVMKRNNTLFDLSAVVTGVLLAFNLPSGLPIWQAVLGSAFAIVVAKQLFGGLGYNPFNPALAGRAFLLVSFASTMTTWSESSWQGEYIATSSTPKAIEMQVEDASTKSVDCVTSATPLAVVKAARNDSKEVPFDYEKDVRKNLFIGNCNGCIGETSALALLIGALWMLYRKVITWHIPVSFLGTMYIFGLIQGVVNPLAVAADFHLLAGGAMLGACFMATDMVTNPVTKAGQVIFGIGCGLLTMIIRNFGAYPEGVSFAILIMNAFTPLINRAIRVRRFGAPKKRKVA